MSRILFWLFSASTLQQDDVSRHFTFTIQFLFASKLAYIHNV